jgi:hypothetical protein
MMMLYGVPLMQDSEFARTDIVITWWRPIGEK